MSMPASSCHLTASSVASSLACGELVAREPPLRPQLVRLGEPGRFRQAAGDGGRKTCIASACDRSAQPTTVAWRLPIIEPIVARAAAFLRPSPACEIADQRLRPASAHRCGPAAGGLLGTRGAAPARAFVGAQRVGRIVAILRQACRRARRRPRSPCRRLARETAASGGRHPRSASPGPRRRGTACLRSYSAHFSQRSGTRDQLARFLGPGPAREMAQDFGAVACARPAGLVPFVVHDGDDVDERAALDRIVHEMRVEPEPEMHQRLRGIPPARHSAGTSARQAVRWRNFGGRCRAQARAHARPQAVGADQRDAAFVEHLPAAACRAR